ncbi:MAG: subclass B3 metallo-beta-lactamase [Pseudomonadota bacterium]
MKKLPVICLLLVLVTACGPRELEPDAAIDCSNCDTWNAPIKPFRIYGNTWYVGTDGLSSILLETDEGLVLIDGALPQSASIIDSNIRELGFDPLNIKAILLSHPHFDHAGGIAALQRLSDATVYASDAAVPTLQTGEIPEDDPQFGFGPESTSFPASENVIGLADGDSVDIGGVKMTIVHTPGHTAGGASWTWQSCALNTCYNVVYADSLTAVSAPGYFYADGAAAEIVDSADRIAGLDCDILLSPHPFFFGLHDKIEKRDEGNPFINNVACLIYAESMLGWLEQRLDSERSRVPD